MALTDSQKADVRYYAGWSARFHMADSGMEHALLALAEEPDHEAQVIALIASLKQVDTDLLAARGRYRADKVGSIELNRAEPSQIRKDGRQFVTRLCSVLGVERGNDVFGGGGASNYVGK